MSKKKKQLPIKKNNKDETIVIKPSLKLNLPNFIKNSLTKLQIKIAK